MWHHMPCAVEEFKRVETNAAPEGYMLSWGADKFGIFGKLKITTLAFADDPINPVSNQIQQL